MAFKSALDEEAPVAPVGVADTMTMASDVDLLVRVAGFLALEADLLDAHRYDDWHALWTEDGQYWVPANGTDTDPSRQVSLIYDDADRLRDRVFRLQQPSAYTQDPPSRICRVIGNVRIIESAPEHVLVSSRYVLESVRHGHRDIYTATAEHRLATAADSSSFAITRKKVVLTANDEALPNLLFLP